MSYLHKTLCFPVGPFFSCDCCVALRSLVVLSCWSITWCHRFANLCLDRWKIIHLCASSLLLFRQLGSLLFFRISSFSSKQSWHSLSPGFLWDDCLTISHFILGAGVSLISQTCFDRVVEFLSDSYLKLCLCLARRFLNSDSVTPT